MLKCNTEGVFLHSFYPENVGRNEWKVVTLLEKNSLDRIREEVESCIGKRVSVKANKGRKRFVTREGILEEVYPNLFVVKISNQFDSTRRVSYTYSDVLTETVQVTICADQSEAQIS